MLTLVRVLALVVGWLWLPNAALAAKAKAKMSYCTAGVQTTPVELNFPDLQYLGSHP